ncbi:hypothetical protein [Trueperella pyogenes]|uniref:hypothetical protein n=1 Tax=Trueperella pyogenes TaxID=1661 RepID=UPI0024BF63CA|nr:hypothetical protein [Trueperella pyogenes]WHU57321.1 hypothetical protein QEV10_01095 [Trueperella pyogenes]
MKTSNATTTPSAVPAPSVEVVEIKETVMPSVTAAHGIAKRLLTSVEEAGVELLGTVGLLDSFTTILLVVALEPK